MMLFPLAWICGMLGMVHDRRRWLALLVAIVAGIFVLQGIWKILT